MKKILSILLIILSLFILISCKNKEPIDEKLSEYDLIKGEYLATLCDEEESNSLKQIHVIVRNWKLYMPGYMKLRSAILKEDFFEDDYVGKDNYEFPKLYYYCIKDNDYYYIMVTKTSDIYIHNIQIVDGKNHIKQSYKLTRFSDLVTELPEVMPSGFSFYMRSDDTFNYTSASGELRVYGGKSAFERGYINLTEKELNEIYLILRNIKIDKMPFDVDACENYLNTNGMEISMKYGAFSRRVIVYAPKNPRNNDWLCYEAFKNSFYKIYDDYIASNPVYKELEEIIANEEKID